ncbi:MAG: glycosyltransferase [Solirubrobacteraceae bacterium]
MSRNLDKNALDGDPRGPLAGLWRRVVLTWHHHGPLAVILRVISFPLRFTPLRRFVMPRQQPRWDRDRALVWYAKNAAPVDIVIPSYRDAERIAVLVASLRRTTVRELARIVVADDASGPEHVAALRAIGGIDELILGECNEGFAANVNRGVRATDPDRDVVILNSDMEALPGWLACLQHGADGRDVGIVGGKLLYPDHRIQFGGTVRNLGAPEWFDHRFRFRAANYGPSNVIGGALAVTGACMYIRREVLTRVGLFDEAYAMAYEDVDLCLRAWQAGYTVLYHPAAQLIHFESETRGTDVGARERASQELFWERWHPFFDARNVRTANGALRIIYVTEGTGVGGGHRDVFEHLNRLAERGHEVALYTLGDAPEWFELRVPVHTFELYADLVEALAPVEAIKVATWWNTAAPVWQASVLHGLPVYFVQDIETSYYPDDEYVRFHVLASYRHEFRYMTISSWNRDRLRELGLEAELIPPGIDLETFRPRREIVRADDVVLAIGRSNPLKNLSLTLAAWDALPQAGRPELRLFGIEPELLPVGRASYEEAPSDERVAELLAQASVFVQTSTHEGFCLPPLEAMATGGAVVCTDAHGNRDFCIDAENCLLVEPTREAVSAGLARVLEDRELRERLGEAGIRTAQEYAWPKRIDALEAFLNEVAKPREQPLASAAVPQIRKQAR